MRIRTWHIVTSLLIAGAVLTHVSPPALLPKVSLESYPQRHSFEEPCPGKERCIVVYMTPWCPVCEASIPFVRTLGQYLKSEPGTGLAVTIGNDELENIIVTANKIGGSVRLDSNDEFLNAASISSFPTWLLVDKEQRVLKRYSGGAPAGRDFTSDEVLRFLRGYLNY